MTPSAIRKEQARMWSASTFSDGESISASEVSRAAAFNSAWNRSIS